MSADDGVQALGYSAAVNGASLGARLGQTPSSTSGPRLSPVGDARNEKPESASHDSWEVLARLVHGRDAFSQCGPVLDGAVDLIVRTAMVRGGLAGPRIGALIEAAGLERLLRLVDQLAAYEAVAIVESLPAAAQRGVNRNGALARERIAAVLRAANDPARSQVASAAGVGAQLAPNGRAHMPNAVHHSVGDTKRSSSDDGSAARDGGASVPAARLPVAENAPAPQTHQPASPAPDNRVFYSMRFKRAISPPVEA